MTQHPPPQPDSADEPNPELDAAAADAPVSPTLHSGIESTMVSRARTQYVRYGAAAQCVERP
jgi:hypothetical protein